MSDTNDITGARLVTKPPSEEYKEGWERIYGASAPVKSTSKCNNWVVGWDSDVDIRDKEKE
jgi:hypothetical protein